jgi:hypothetical protein
LAKFRYKYIALWFEKRIERAKGMSATVEVADRQSTDHRVAIPMPNGYMRAALEAIEEIAGEKSLNAMLRFAGLENAIGHMPPDNLAFDAGYVFRDYSNLNHAIVDFYGRAGKVHALRIGRRSAQWMIQNHPLFGFAGVVFKTLPSVQALRIGLNNTMEGFRKLYRNVHFDIRIQLTETDSHFIWSSPDCPCCVGKQANQAICWIWEAGLIEGAHYVTGNHYAVQQVACIAAGAPECRWLISKSPSSVEGH